MDTDSPAPAHNTSISESSNKKTRLPIFLARLVTIAVMWVIASRLVISPSERFYLIVPWIFTTEALWKFLAGDKKGTRKRINISAFGFGILAAFYVAEFFSAAPFLQPGELPIIGYALISLLVIASSCWNWSWSFVQRAMGLTAETKTSKRLPLRLGCIVVFALFFNALALSFLETHWSKRMEPYSPTQFRLTYDNVSWTSKDGTRIVGWFIPAHESDRTAIVCHGVGAYKADMLEFVRALHEADFNVLTFDFRSHGQSGGHTVTYGKQEKWDIISGVDMLQSRYSDRCKRIVGVSWSMGASSLILAAAHDNRIEALHLDAAYARTFDIARVITARIPPVFKQVGLYLGTAFGCAETQSNLFEGGPINVISEIAPRPIMLVHGTADQIIPIEQGRLLFEQAGEPKYWHEIAGSNHCQTLQNDSPNYEKRMIAFLEEALNEAATKEQSR